MAVSKRLRYEILRRDSHTCRYCGASAPDVPLRVDHVTPVALGGTDTPDNLVASCEPCNSGKSSASPDAHHVGDVADDALRWAAAMKQAADELSSQQEPKRAYRIAFQKAWNEWTWERGGKKETFELPAGWKTSLDNFREAGLPQEVWPDIVEKTMTNKTVNSDNLFRYACGIGWRMVRELQDRAKVITGQAPVEATPVDPIVAAALKVWTDEREEAGTAEERARLQETAAAVLKREDPHRVLEGAQYAAWYGMTGVNDALAQRDMDYLVQRWTFSWLAKTGEWPDDKRTKRVTSQCEALLASGIDLSRLSQAAVYAGAHRSMRLYFGLSEEELKATNQSAEATKAAEVWSQSFYASTARWPDGDEMSAFFTNLWRVGDDGDMWTADIYPAAAAAGLYQDPDIGTCITRHLSVFEIAARPMGGGN
ncbi:HNH endonuclease [Streptomyces sp. NPDC058466]|uniref:HNH endonuclease n=1 Tax=Streptomyces sp. NPDC058466 TaxID=3346512 RepID=UPI00364EF579